ncbi:MAG: hypothetical protein QOF21_2453 [Actinomycetota bacterium]
MGGPPILVVSTPRSGSSWVGNGLALAADVAYLREPLSEANSRVYRNDPSEILLRPGKGSPTFEFDRNNPPDAYRQALRCVARGVPAFGYEVVPRPQQWSLAQRSRTRVILKEVNPFAIEWLLREMDWRVVYLVRHPGAVAVSRADRGWTGGRLVGNVRDEHFATTGPPTSHWEAMGAIEAIVQREVVTRLDEWAPGRNRVVRFESLCADPIAEFERLYEFTGLGWNDDVKTQLGQMTQSGAIDSSKDAWGTQRDTARMADAWRTRISDEDLELVMDAWRRHGGDDEYS